MKERLLCKRSFIAYLLLALLTGCATTPVETPTREPTATSVPPTNTPVPPTVTPKPTSCVEMEGICLELTFDGESCTYEGPTEFKTVPVTLFFFNESDRIAATNMIRLLEDKTFQDLVVYTGDEPSTKHHPSWSVEIPGVWKEIKSGDSHIWNGVLEPGTHAIVCVRIMPLGVWLGSGFRVEDE